MQMGAPRLGFENNSVEELGGGGGVFEALFPECSAEPVLKLGWEVTKRRCAVSAKRPQSVRKRPQASASVREWRNACC